MKGMFCNTTARNDEEFKAVLKKRMRLLTGLLAAGVLTGAFGFCAHFLFADQVNEHMVGIIAGMGSGITAASIVLVFKNRKTLRDEKKLHYERLQQSDERIREISSKSYRMASTVVLAALYITCLGGGLFYPQLVYLLGVIVLVFLAAYFISYAVYQKKI